MTFDQWLDECDAPQFPNLRRRDILSPRLIENIKVGWNAAKAENRTNTRVQSLREEVTRLAIDKASAYEERNRVVAALAHEFPAGIRKTAIEGWDPEWHNCVFIDTPAGQLSW